MTRTPKNPAASALAPAEPRSAAQATPGGPSLAVPPVAGEGGYSPSPPSRERADSDGARPGDRRERTRARPPGPGTGTTSPRDCGTGRNAG